MDKEERLYHYCDIESFIKIIKGRKLKFSNLSSSNDYDEIVYMFNAFVEKDNHFSSKYFIDEEINNKKYYSICFSENRDDLSMWRGYAYYGGFAIGFSMDKLKEYSKRIEVLSRNASFVEVEYVNKEKMENIVNTIIDECKKKGDFTINCIPMLIENTCKYKNDGFASEKEHRIYFYNFNGNDECQENNGSQVFDITTSIPTVYYANKEIEKSHLDYYLIPFELNMISEIIIGPKNSISIDSLVSCLKLIDSQIAWDNIVKKTHLTYR